MFILTKGYVSVKVMKYLLTHFLVVAGECLQFIFITKTPMTQLLRNDLDTGDTIYYSLVDKQS